MNEPFQLSHLNDDCLRELFSRLPNIDLCAIKDTCRRFKTIADEVAKQRFKYLYECYPTDENLQEHKTNSEEIWTFRIDHEFKRRP